MSTLTDGLFVTPKNLLCVMGQYNKFVKASDHPREKRVGSSCTVPLRLKEVPASNTAMSLALHLLLTEQEQRILSITMERGCMRCAWL